MKKAFFLLILSCISIKATSQYQQSASEILQDIKRLKVLGAVLYVAAHPDDENTRLLTYLTRELNVRTAYLSITRGDGGQNLVGKEQGELLGLIRTQELLAARKIDGAEQFFTRANDFGYSKNPEETFKFWNKDSILSDMVWVIRNFKPDVIITRFPVTGEGGHGHHTASAMLALEAFDAASDPDKFKWQLKHTGVWKTRRVYWNTFNFGSTNTTSSDQLQIDVGGYNNLIGKSYGEIAAQSRSMHKSQGFGSASTRGSQVEFFKQLKGDSASDNLFSSIELTWKKLVNENSSVKINDVEPIIRSIDHCIKNYDVNNPSASIPSLISLLNEIKKLSDKDEMVNYWKKQKSKEIESLIVKCSGLFMEVTANRYSSVPGNTIELSAHVVNRSEAEIKLNRINWNNLSDTSLSLTLKQYKMSVLKHAYRIPKHVAYSDPFWLNLPHQEGLYAVKDLTKIANPENEFPLSVFLDCTIEGSNFTFERPVVYKSTDPIKGEVYRPFEILPEACVNFSSRSYVFTNSTPSLINIHLKTNVDSLKGRIKLQLPEGWTSSPSEFEFGKILFTDDKIFEVIITPPANNSIGTISALIITGKDTISKSLQRIEYDHIPDQFMLSEAKARLVSLDLKMAGKKIGYIPGAGDDVASNLSQIGFDVTLLPQEILSKQDLKGFDAIITGIRAFNTNEWLQDYDKKLLDYVNSGGNLIVQYNTNNRIGPLMTKIFPYPFTISRERTTDENAEVRMLNSSHPSLNYPNSISNKDFSGWIQERGIYFASDIDSSYSKIFSMNDPGDKPNEGSLIIGKYGKGNFVYTGLAFFRQLPAGVPGAYKLFVNLISLPKNQDIWKN